MATGPYRVYIEDFLDSLANLRPNDDKMVVLLTDNDDETYYTRGYLHIVHHRISDEPWPIICLLKMWYVNKYWVDCNEAFYLDIDTLVTRDLPNISGRIMLTRHTWAWKDGNDGHDFLHLEDDNPESLSYIGRLPYTYVQSGSWGGDAEVVHRMVRDVSDWVEDDLTRNIIPRWHDESYLNKWQVINREYCVIDRYMGDGCAIQFNNNPNFKNKRR